MIDGAVVVRCQGRRVVRAVHLALDRQVLDTARVSGKDAVPGLRAADTEILDRMPLAIKAACIRVGLRRTAHGCPGLVVQIDVGGQRTIQRRIGLEL